MITRLNVKLVAKKTTENEKGETAVYLTVQQADKRFHFSDDFNQLGQCRVVVFL